MRYRELSLKYNHEVYLYNEGYLEDLYHRFPELRDTFLFPEKDSPCLVDIKTGYCYIKVFPNVSDLCNSREWWIRTDTVKDPEQYKEALNALNKMIYKQETINKMRELLCTMILASCYIFSTVMFFKFIDLTKESVGAFALDLFLILLISVVIGLFVYLIFYEGIKEDDIEFARIMNDYIKPV